MDEKKLRNIFVDNLHYYMNIKNKSQADISRALDIPMSTVSNWYNGASYPRVDKMGILADYFNISMTCLTDERKDDDQDIITIGRAAKKMTPEEKEKMMDILKAAFKDKFSND